YENLKSECKKINVLGSSYGGTIALRLAEEKADDPQLGHLFIVNGFLGTSVPFGLDAEGFDALLSPESPTQFYAYFSEVPFTDATSPATSHYKVYYHIYAGNDFGASYLVYLRNPPSSTYYASIPTVNVKTGYATVGQSADESIDFTAPSGYKELCVRINNEEHCGFGTVSSDFLVNYASEKYTEDQATKTDITTEEECVSTSSSAWGLVSPNLQSGVETAVGGKDINLAGITRVCASSNPSIGIASEKNTVVCTSDNDCGSGYICNKANQSSIGNCVDNKGNIQQSAGRWVDVGYCGYSSIRCWLDSSTLEDRFKAINAVNQELYGKNMTVTEAIKYGELFDDVKENYEQARAKLSEQYNRILKLTPSQLLGGDTNSEISSIFVKLDEVIGVYVSGEGTSNNKAEALGLKATVYRMIVEQKIKNLVDVSATGTTDVEDYVSIDPINYAGDSVYTDSISSTNPSLTNSNNAVSSGFDTQLLKFSKINGKEYISYGDSFVSSYYINSNSGRTLILRENPNGAIPTPVGEIDSNGLITITSDLNVAIGDMKLGDLNGLSYKDNKFLIVDVI
ncbi:MAG: hypothetical protein KKF65_06780, partial [Nanoarchaeota archaeon]|nr:hypothetical protein [Nanoarchaeota archaeon]